MDLISDAKTLSGTKNHPENAGVASEHSRLTGPSKGTLFGVQVPMPGSEALRVFLDIRKLCLSKMLQMLQINRFTGSGRKRSTEQGVKDLIMRKI